MLKLKLEIESLDVQSFETVDAPPPDGTVFGLSGAVTCNSCDSCDPTCAGETGGWSCPGQTCAQSCGGTCPATCNSCAATACGGTCNSCGAATCEYTCVCSDGPTSPCICF